MVRILVVDDEADIRDLISDILSDEGYNVATAYNMSTMMQALEKSTPDVIMLDIWLEGNHMDGIGILRKIKEMYPFIAVVMISGHASNEIAAQTIKIGAYDFIEKPFNTAKLISITQSAAKSVQEIIDTDPTANNREIAELVGDSTIITNIRKSIESTANTNSRVLITGEFGIDVASVARNIHSLSSRKLGRFCSIDISQESVKSIEKQLFSPEENNNLIHQSEGGTLFINSIAKMNIDQQEQLLATIQNLSNAKLIVADQASVTQLADDHNFSEGLLQRISTTNINLVPLRERPEDIVYISEHLVESICRKWSIEKFNISSKGYAIMVREKWHGNIMQLNNFIEKIALLSVQSNVCHIDEKMIKQAMQARHIDTESLENSMFDANYKKARQLFEAFYLQMQISRFGNSITRTAKFINVDRAALHRKLKTLGITKAK